MKAIILKLFGFALLGTLATVIFVAITFPDDKLEVLVERHLEKALDYEYRVDAVEFEAGFFNGVEMKQITLTPRFTFDTPEFGDGSKTDLAPPVEGEEEAEQTLAQQYFCPMHIEPSPVLIDLLAVDPSWLSIIGGDLEGTFKMEAAGGTVEGSLGAAEEDEDAEEDDAAPGQAIQATIDNIALQRFTLLRNMMEMHLVGMFGGEVDLTFGEGFKLTGGSIDVRLSRVVMCPKKFEVQMPNVPIFELPLTRLGDIAGTIEVSKKRRLEFKNFKGSGEDMDIEVMGHIQLATEKHPESRYDVRIKLTPDQQWVDDNMMDALFKICRRFDDGSVQFIISTAEGGKVKKDCVRARKGGATRAGATRRTTPASRRAAKAAPPATDVELDEAPDAFPKEKARVKPTVSSKSKSSRPFPAGVSAMGPKRGTRPPTNAEIKAKAKPVPLEKSRQMLKVYD